MAKIKDEDISALRERADLAEIVGAYTKLKKSGGNRYTGLCPFHSEKTPSFSIDNAKGLFFCFGCNEGGDVFRFVEKIESLPFVEAVEWLAHKSGFQLHYEEQRPGDRHARGLKQRIIQANEEATRFFHETLMATPAASSARDYLSGRGFPAEAARRWEIGFAPGGNSLTRHLLGKGFSQEELLKADLTRRSERDGSLYDTFRGRIVFPTRSHQGDVVGFGARALGDQKPKYVNTSETPVFQKSRFMYGLHKAKVSLARGEAAIVVEGYTDVIALHEAGIGEAVATNGVALGETHFELLKRFTHRAVLMFDADEAGKGATERGFEYQHRLGLDVLVAPLPAGKDPADAISSHGPDPVRAAIAAARPLMEFKLEQTIGTLVLDTPEAKGRAVRAAAEVLGWHPDPVARHEYAFLAARRIGVDPDGVQRVLAERGAQRPAGAWGGDGSSGRRLPGHVKVEREALQVLVTRTRDAARWAGLIGETDFTSPARAELFNVARAAMDAGKAELTAEEASRLSPEAFSLYTELAVAANGTEAEDRGAGLEEIFVRLRLFRLERDIKVRRNTLQEVNPLVDAKRHDDLFTQLVKLEAERRDLLRHLQGVA